MTPPADLPPEYEAFRTRAMAHFDGLTDQTLIVLKGHLLIEETMNMIISKLFHTPDLVLTRAFNFARKLTLIEASLTDSRTDALPVEAIRLLNTIRNKMSHSLDYDQAPQRLNEFTRSVIEHMDEDLPAGLSPEMKVTRCIGYVTGRMLAWTYAQEA